MLAVVVCLRGNGAKFAADFLRGKDCQVGIAIGPNHLIETMQAVESKAHGPAILVTDSAECLSRHALCSAYGPGHPTIFWGDDPDGRATRASVRLPESADLAVVAQMIRRLASGLPIRPDDPDLVSRLRR